MSTTNPGQAKLFLALAKRISDPNAMLSATEEAAIASFLPPPSGEAVGFPAGPAGDARGSNAMRRTNWFNGRFLTAEALRRQDSYFDIRARLDAHLLMPGVAHGLGLSASGLNAMPVQVDGNAPPSSGGFGKSATITLSPGLAFDHAGRPILVSLPFPFTLEQLISTQQKTPRRVAPGGLDFAPCVCLVPDPAGPSGGSAAVRPGCYLLVIEPGETPEGEARVYGEACAGSGPTNCQSESWRGGFGLSLVRVPLELPEEEGLNTAWALRGTASAWWFDVFEHSLIRRWDPDFATDGGFAKPTGPGRHESGAVALAMLWLGTDGSAIFLDRWIPRRSIVATPAEDWHRTRFGAPPRAAAWARIHQFQAMLDESLDLAPLVDNQQGGRLNLWQRGFRHIPPIGFLPLDPAAVGDRLSGEKGSTGVAMLDRIIEAGGGRIQLVSGLIAGAKRQAFSYFSGTTVLSYCVVALHDDDILEDLGNVFDKDPVQLARRAPRDSTAVPANPATGANTDATAGFLDRLGEIFDVIGLDELINRRTEVVKIIIPLQGLTRAHPVLGVVPEDARGQAAAWLGAQPPGWWTSAANLYDARGMAQLAQRLPLEMLPRHFAVYVKQRMVLLDVLVLLIEVLHAIVILARDTQRDAKTARSLDGATLGTADYALAYRSQPAEQRAIAEAALAEPVLRDAVARAAVAASPDLRLPARNAAFTAQVQATEAQLAEEIADPALRQRAALERVTDSYAAEYSGFQVMQIIAAVQPASQARETFGAIAAQAATQPLRDAATGARVEATLADSLVEGGPRIFAKPESAAAYASMTGAIAGKSAASYAPGAPEGLTVRDILSKPSGEAARLLGGEARLATFREALAKEKTEAATAAETLAATPPPSRITERLSEALARGEDANAALESLRTAPETDGATRTYLDATGTMIRNVGLGRTLDLARRVTPRRET